MKYLLSIFLVAILTLVAACKGGSGSSASPEGKLTGKWEIVKAVGDMAEANQGTQYVFDGKGGLTFGKGIIQNPGTTTITDSSFTFQAKGNDLKFDYTYRFEGNQLVIKMKGSNQTFWLDKK